MIQDSSNIDFLLQVGKAVNVYRKIYAIDSNKLESVAEHSFHMILTAILLLKNKLTSDQLLKVIELICVHDLGEIDIGDISFNLKSENDKNNEELNYKKVISSLPEEKQTYFINLWSEFENNKTIEAKYAKAIDKLQSQLLIYYRIINNLETVHYNKVKIEELRDLVFKYILEIFPEYEFILTVIEEDLKCQNKII